MSRRKLQVRRAVKQAGGDVNKIIPSGAAGKGAWLTKAGTIDGREMRIPSPGETKGTTCSLPIGTRKEQLFRNWAK